MMPLLTNPAVGGDVLPQSIGQIPGNVAGQVCVSDTNNLAHYRDSGTATLHTSP